MRIIGCLLGLLLASPALAAETLPALTGIVAPSTPPFNATGYPGTGFLSTGFSVNSVGNVAALGLVLNNAVMDWTAAVVPLVSVSGRIGTATLVNSNATAVNVFNLNSDNVDATTAAGLYNMYVGTTVGGSNVKGHRTGFVSVISVASPTGNLAGKFYTAASALALASSNDNNSGNLFAALDQAQLLSGATSWNSVVGREIDVAIRTGASAAYKVGFQIVLMTTDVVPATTANYAMGVANQLGGASPGWDYGITIGAKNGIWPMAATGTLIGADTTTLGGPAYAAAYGVNFSNVTFSGAAFKSNAFSVDGAGIVTGSAYKTGATAGVTCAGAPTASFASTGGIVTHC